MKIGFIIDALPSLFPYKDSSIDLMIEGQRRGHEIEIFEFQHITVSDKGAWVQARAIHWQEGARKHARFSLELVRLGQVQRRALEEYQVIFIRKDPPFDSHYLALALNLERFSQQVRFVNAPRGLHTISEKLYALRFGEAVPPTLVSYELEALRDFAAAHEKVVLKPAFFGSGKGVVLSSYDDLNFAEHIRLILQEPPHGPVIAQAFLPQVIEGDIRVMMLNGQPVAAIGRKPPPGDFRANVAIGGTVFATQLNARQHQLACMVGKSLVENGIIFGGLDFIGDKLIEINVTSPTLIQELRAICGFDMASALYDFLEQSPYAPPSA